MNKKLERLHNECVVPVLRFDDAEVARFAVNAVLAAGFGAVELTYTIPKVLDLVAELRAAHGDKLLLGVGTVVNVRQAEDALSAGADFVVSPFVVPGMAAKVRSRDRFSMVGAFTPGEVSAALNEAAEVVKVFPASSGGPSHVSALRSVFPQAMLCPTGGISIENISAFLQVGAAFVGVGNSLIDKQALITRDAARAAESGRRYRQAALAAGRIVGEIQDVT
jgi:2-dehydro-3-deoxyphosphogluconate aldolase/(4S)-4-hydroxy-2-oxoglutarate aldolase